MIGQKISHYRIDAELGRGGMGVVYRAHDERLRRNVALKVLPQEIASQEERRARILTEARAASALNHPGITTIYEVGEDGERLFLVMELVTGKTLRALLRDGAADARTAARLGSDVAEALGAAHAQGVVHGDIKPENIMVMADGRVKLLDFGIARQAAEQTLTKSRTTPSPEGDASSSVTGTLAYMAPELLRGQPADARTDLFALGVTLYELVAGHRPFPGPSPTALAGQILREAPDPLERAAPGSATNLARIVHRLLEKQPEARYQSARETQADLTNLLREMEMGPVHPAVSGKKAVAVLPFALLTPNAADEYLSVALANAVIHELSRSEELLVRPTSLVLRYARQAVDPRIAARELNVQVVVEGSIQKAGTRLRVHVQAWDSASDATLLSVKHDAEAADLFGLQDRIADSLARALGTHAREAGGTSVAPPTQNPRAYELYLRAGERLARWNLWDTRTAIEMLESATKMDARFADAWAHLAEARRQLGILFAPGPQWVRQAERDVRRALAMDPQNAEALRVRGRILFTPEKKFQNAGAIRALRDALRRNPGSYLAQVELGCIYFHVGLHPEAREALAAALAISPDDALALAYAGQTAAYEGNFEEAQEYLARAARSDPGHLWVNLFGPGVHLLRDDLDRAELEIRAAQQAVGGDPSLTSFEALLWAKRGEKRKAMQAIQRAMRGKQSQVHTHHKLHSAAATYALLGEPARALSLLRRAAATGLPNHPLFRDDPHFTSMRRHPGFVKLLAGLKQEWQGYQKEFGKRS